MITQQLKSIIFNGVKGEAYGGNIFAFRIEGNGIEAPPKYVVSIAFSPGSGGVSLPPTSSSATIKIGDDQTYLGGNLELFSTSVENNPEYTAVHLTYIDRTCFLDRTYVGINYRHGVCLSDVCGEINGMVILGGEIFETETTGKECMNCANEVVTTTTPATYNTCDNKDAGYTVDSFMRAFGSHIGNIGLLGRAGSAPLSYTGTLREVLSSICSDAGATFMVDYAGGVSIVDGSSGVPIVDTVQGKGGLYIKKSTLENSKEGTYVQAGSTFGIKPTRTISQTRDNYEQFLLTPVNTTVTLDVELGMISLLGPMLRDQACKQLGLYNRLGFYGGLYSPNPNGGIYQNSMKQLADCMQDSTLLDLVGQKFTYWYLTRYSDELKNYYLNIESNAVQDYGTLYKTNISRPASNTERTCLPKDFRQVTTYEYYPDIDPGGYWRKNVSPKDLHTTKLQDLSSYYAPVIVPLVGELLEKYVQCGGAVNTNNAVNLAFVAWKDDLQGVRFDAGQCVHPDEELKHPIEQKDTFCLLPCENQEEDACQKLNKSCSKGSAGIYQGSESNVSFCLAGIVLPSNSVFWGWKKKSDDLSKLQPGTFMINGEVNDGGKSVIPNLSAGSAQSVRYSLIDASNNPQISPPSSSFFAESQTRTYEIIGEFVPVIDPSLKSWNISIDGNGVFTTVSYQNRPPIISKQDNSLGKITPKKILLRS